MTPPDPPGNFEVFGSDRALEAGAERDGPSVRSHAGIRPMEESEIHLRVRYAETDQMGRAHHAHHLVWCEAGRTAWLRERGTSYREIESDGVYLPVSKVEVRYNHPVGYDEEVRVRTRLEEVRSRTLRFRYDVERVEDGRLVAEVETELVCVDGEGRVRRLPGSLREALGEDERG